VIEVCLCPLDDVGPDLRVPEGGPAPGGAALHGPSEGLFHEPLFVGTQLLFWAEGGGDGPPFGPLKLDRHVFEVCNKEGEKLLKENEGVL